MRELIRIFFCEAERVYIGVHVHFEFTEISRASRGGVWKVLLDFPTSS